MKLQKQLSRKYNNEEYAKWVIVIPPDKIRETGWKEGEDLEVIVKNGKVVVEKKED